MSRPTLSLPSRNPSLPGACSGMPTGTSGSCGEINGIATATTVTRGTRLTAAQLTRDDGDFSSESRSWPRIHVPPVTAIAMSARLPFDAGHLVRAPWDALQPDVELRVVAGVDRDRASGMERATGGRLQRAGGFACQYP